MGKVLAMASMKQSVAERAQQLIKLIVTKHFLNTSSTFRALFGLLTGKFKPIEDQSIGNDRCDLTEPK